MDKQREKPSSFVVTKHLSFVNETATSLKEYLLELVCYALKETGGDKLPYIQSLFCRSEKFYSILPRDALLNNASKALKQRVLKEYGVKSIEGLKKEIKKLKRDEQTDRDYFKKLFTDRMKEVPAGEEDQYLHNLLFRAADLAATLNILDRRFDKHGSFLKEMNGFLSPSKTYQDNLIPGVREVRSIRNDYIGHDNLEKREKLDRNETLRVFREMGKLADCFRDDIEVESIRTRGEAFGRTLEENRQKVSAKPIPFSDIEALPDYEDVLFQRFDHEYDDETKTLYFWDFDQVSSYFEECMRTYRVRDEKFSETATDSGDTIQPDVAFAESRRPYSEWVRLFPAMAGYTGGRLSNEQFEELMTNTTVMVDAEFWMDKENIRFLSYEAAFAVAAAGRRIVVDWDTRVELFGIEKNIGEEYPPEQVRLAKRAHNAMTMMNIQRFVHYLPRADRILSSKGRILKTIESNPDVDFTVFTRDKAFCDLLQRKGLTNVIPVYRLADGKCSVRLSALPLVTAFFTAPEPEDEEAATVQSDSGTTALDSPQSMDRSSDKTLTENESRSMNNAEQSQKKELPKEDEMQGEPDGTTEDTESSLDKNQKDASESQTEATGPAKSSPAMDGPPPVDQARKTPKKEKKPIRLPVVPVITDSGERLPLSSLPGLGDSVTISDGKRLSLIRVLGQGGEGTVYQTDQTGIVAKIYHEEKVTKNRKDKLTLMIDNRLGIPQVCWPIALLYNQADEFCGYTMPSAAGYTEFGQSVLQLGDKDFAAKEMPDWNRRTLVQLCIQICDTFQRMHRKGILMGDVNPRNMMLKKRTKGNIQIMFVDCDSFQIGGYPCPVGTPVFTSPEIYFRVGPDPKFGTFLRTLEDEYYAVASLLFHILMLNQSPFSGKGVADITTAIKNYNFAYRLSDDPENTGAQTPDGFSRMIWNNTPKRVKEAFGSVFKGKETLSEEIWLSHLRRYLRDMDKGYYSVDLTPERYWENPWGEESYNIDFVCHECGRSDLNMPKERYQNEERRHLPHLCNTCRTLAEAARNTEVVMQCSRCKKNYAGNEWDQYLIENGFLRYPLCPACRQSRRTRR